MLHWFDRIGLDVQSGRYHLQMLQAGPRSLSPIAAGLGTLLSKTKGEVLDTVLSTLQRILEQDSSASARWLPSITPVMLRIWATNLQNPLLTLTLLDIFGALAASPSATSSLQVQILKHQSCSAYIALSLLDVRLSYFEVLPNLIQRMHE